MDVRVKLTTLEAAKTSPKQEILTGLPDGSLKGLLDTLATRHPELSDVFKEAGGSRTDMKIYVNNSEVPASYMPKYFLRDGDTVSLFVKNP